MAFEVGSNAAFVAHSAHVMPSVGDGVVPSDGVQGVVASVDGDMLSVDSPLSGSRCVHAASVHKVPSWREEALALDADVFDGCATAECAFFGSSPVVSVDPTHVPVNLFDDGGEMLIDWDDIPEQLCLVSKSALKKKEEDERDHMPGLFTSAKANEKARYYRIPFFAEEVTDKW